MKLRTANEQDYQKLYNLFEENNFLAENVTQSDFHQLCDWLYLSTPYKQVFELVIEKEEKIIGHHGLTPFGLRTDSMHITAGLASNLLIDASHRNALIFMLLQREFFSKYKSAGFDCIFGLVNKPEVLSTHLKTGYRKICDIPIFARPINFSILTKKQLPGLFGKLIAPPMKPIGYFYDLIFNYSKTKKKSIVEIKKFDISINCLCHKFLNFWETSSVKNYQILNWRYFTLRHREYKIYLLKDNEVIKGYIVLRKMPMKSFSTLAIVDLVWDTDDIKNVEALIEFACQKAKQEEVDLTSILITPTKEILKSLKKFGFIKTPEKFTLVVNTPKGKQLFDNDNYSQNWFVTWFDHDYV